MYIYVFFSRNFEIKRNKKIPRHIKATEIVSNCLQISIYGKFVKSPIRRNGILTNCVFNFVPFEPIESGTSKNRVSTARCLQNVPTATKSLCERTVFFFLFFLIVLLSI